VSGLQVISYVISGEVAKFTECVFSRESVRSFILRLKISLSCCVIGISIKMHGVQFDFRAVILRTAFSIPRPLGNVRRREI
jgi:hypothetical protein